MGNGTGFFRKVHWTAIPGFLWKLAAGPHMAFGMYTLLALVCCGVANVLIDLDHLVIEQTQMVRPLHLQIWVCSGIVCCCYCAYLRRRVHILGLKEKEASND
jgi:hypothetical protein